MATTGYSQQQTDVRKAEGEARDSMSVVTDYETLTDAMEKEYDTGAVCSDEELQYGGFRVFTSGESATVHFFPNEELEDQELIYGLENDDSEVRQKYRETLDPVAELFGGEEKVGELLEETRLS